jgi:hypothetical protein
MLVPPIAQPEDAGARIGRMVHRVADGVLPPFVQHRALDRLLIAHGALVEAARHPGIGDDPALAHRRGECGVRGDPVVDGTRADAEQAGQVGIGGAQQAVVVRELAKVGAVKRGTSGVAHGWR